MKGEVFAYVGLLQNLKDLKSTAHAPLGFHGAEPRGLQGEKVEKKGGVHESTTLSRVSRVL